MSIFPAVRPAVSPAVRGAFEQGSGGGAASIIAGLFAQGQQGFWLPFTDFASLTQDSAGTLPYTALEQPVGLILDKSKGGGRGPELSPNGGTFDDAAGWTITQPTSSISGGVLNVGAGACDIFPTTASVVAGKSYEVTFTISNSTANYGIRILNRDIIGTGNYFPAGGQYLTANGSYRFVCVALSNGSIGVNRVIGHTGSLQVDNFSVKEIPGNHASQVTSTARPKITQAVGQPKYLTFDGVDDRLQAPLPAITGTWIVGYKEGTLVYKVNIPAGAFPIGTNTNAVFSTPSKNFVGMVLRAGDLTDAEVSVVERYLVANGAGAAGVDAFAGVSNFSTAWLGLSSLTSFPLINTAAGTNFSSAWYLCSSLTSFPLINTASGTNFYAAWYGCTSLTSFPLINTAAGTNFYVAWYGCASLTSFPANMFDSCPATNFSTAFQNCALSQVSVDGILASLVTAGKSNGTLNMHGGTSSTPSAGGLASKATLVSRGWTVTHN